MPQVRGPTSNLWLDYHSRVPLLLSKVSTPKEGIYIFEEGAIWEVNFHVFLYYYWESVTFAIPGKNLRC